MNEKMKKTLGLNKTRKDMSRIWRAIMSEYLATTLFVFVACASVTVGVFGGTSSAQNLVAGFAQGLAIAALVATLANTSGGHINPAVTFALMISGNMPVLVAIGYIIAQLAGGITGAAILSGVLPGQIEGTLGTTMLAHGVSRFQGFLFEMMVTLLLIFTIFGTAIDKDDDGSIKSLAPIPIGFAVTAGVTIAYTFTGGSLNPARTFGPAVISNTWGSHYIYWAGPLAGALIAALFYRIVLSTKPGGENSSQSGDNDNDDKKKKNPRGDNDVPLSGISSQ